MDRKIKLIWDFRAEDALEMAKHHCVHLEEFALANSLPFIEIASKPINELYSIAFIIVSEQYLRRFRDALKPHRGELA